MTQLVLAPFPDFHDSADVMKPDLRLRQLKAIRSTVVSLIDRNDGERNSKESQIWGGHGTFLCAYGISVSYGMAEADAARIRAELVALQYLCAKQGDSAEPPEWWDDEHVHAWFRMMMVSAKPEQYESVLDTETMPRSPALHPYDPKVWSYEGPDDPSDTLCWCRRGIASVPTVTPIGTWWSCERCGRPKGWWLRAATKYLPFHSFDGGEYHGSVLSTLELADDPSIMTEYRVTDKVVEYAGTECILWVEETTRRA